MKLKQILLTCLLAIVGSMAEQKAFAYTAKIDGICYYFNGDEAIVTDDGSALNQSSYIGDIVIPRYVTYKEKTYCVTCIDNGAFKDCSYLRSVTLPSSMTSIGYDAFSACTSLTSINIPNSMTSIGDYAFSGCCGLTTPITIGSGVTSIGNGVFSNCSSLTSITIGNNVTRIGRSAFYGCTSLTSITIPQNVAKIDDDAFYGCNNLTAVNIMDLVAWCRISFSNSASQPLLYARHLYLKGQEIKDLVIPKSIEYIYNHAFRGCTGLTSVTFHKNVFFIGDYAFFNCLGLKDVYCSAEDIPVTCDHTFTPSASTTLHVPAGSVEAYLTTAPWSGFGYIVAIDERIIEDLSELSNNKQYLIYTRNENRGTLGVIDNHLASTNPAAYGQWVCRPVVLDRSNPLITSVSQLYSPYTEPTEGSLAAMIDGNTETFWHSVWSQGGTVEAGTHYFQVEMLNQADIDVAFKLVRRQTDNDHITEWGVYGTNNASATKKNCTKLAVIETPYKKRGETCVSEIFKTGGYKYLRFYINKTTRSNFGHLAEFQLYPATYDEEHGEASPFAIIQKNGGYYLYSVLDEAFITPVNNGDESANPLVPSDNKLNIYKRDDHFVFDFIDTGNTINVNFDPGIAIDDYGTQTNKFDDGNLFTIEEAGYFDPTEALAKFETQTFTVTYNVMYEGEFVISATEKVSSGDPLPPAPASLYNDFIILTNTGTPPPIVTEDVTVTYTATWNGPFEFTKAETNAKWYNMHIRSGYYVGKQESEPYYPTKNVDEATLATPAYQWAFGGDPYHVMVYNRTTGLDETLRKNGDNAVMRAGEYTWDLLPNSDGFVLRVPGTDYSCINQYGSTSGPLQFWTNNKALTDDGSTFRVEEVVETFSPAIEFADAGVKALCVANWDTNGDGELSEEEAAAVTDLGTVFKGKTNIKSFNELQYFTGLTSIGNSAFYGCSNLTSITIPGSVTSIRRDAFSGCSGLTSITIPKSVTSIGINAFAGCTKLTSIKVETGNTKYDSRNNCNAIIETETNILIAGCKNTVIPNSVTSIGNNAFSGCSGLTSITIPESVTSIGYSAFYGCSGLTSVTIPGSVTSIGGDAFSDCSGLTTVTIPNSITSIYQGAFSGCTSLADVWCYAKNVPNTSSDAFSSSNNASATLHVPAVSLNAYRSTAPWSSFGMIVPIDGFVINDETTSFSIAAEESGDVIFTHNFTGDWEALYLPFAINYDNIKANFDLAEIDGVVQNDDDNDGIADITVLSIMGFKGQMTEPNTPYLIRAKSEGEQTIVFNNVTLYPTEAATFDCSSFSIRYEFTGSDNTLGASALINRYIVQGGELVKGASKLSPCRWYMTATSKTGGAVNLPNKIRIMLVEDLIDGVSPLGETEEGAAIYNLSGQMVNGKW